MTVGSPEPRFAADGEYPPRQIAVAPFAIEPFATTNSRFGAFVAATGYVTEAERFGWSFVFAGFLPDDHPPTAGVAGTPWWRKVDGACWRQPEGPGSDIASRMDHPVVHVSWNDAAAFAGWVGGRLPAEAEWELAASGGLAPLRFPWGAEEPTDQGPFLCNIWQGAFPAQNTCADGYSATAPVSAFAPNQAGLYNMVGNVWEWCSDARQEPFAGPKQQLMKGGSYLCHRSYCYRYRIAARAGNTPDTSTGHIGFRVAYDES